MIRLRQNICTVLMVFGLTAGLAGQGAGTAASGSKPVHWEQMNDGPEFSVAIPSGYQSSVDGNYFMPPSIDIDKRITVTRLINGVFLMVELYQGDVKDIRNEQVARLTKGDAAFVKVDEKKLDAAEMQEYRQVKDGQTDVQRFYLTKKRLYVVQAMAPRENDPIMAAFLDSVRVGKGDQAAKPPTPIDEITAELVDEPISGKPDREVVIITKPRPSYTSEARSSGVTGSVVLKTLFSANGRVTKVLPVSGPRELWKSSTDAASRIKFLPAQKDGKLVSVWKSITYTFSIY